MKQCIKCESQESKLWYHGPLCGKCYRKIWVTKNVDKVKNSRCRYVNKNSEKERTRHRSINSRFCSARKNAKKRNKIWNISLAEFSELASKSCYCCNNEMGAGENYGSGLDRINNSIGYELSNVMPCCKICNSMRNNYLTIEETKIAVKAILMHRKLKEVKL